MKTYFGIRRQTGNMIGVNNNAKADESMTARFLDIRKSQAIRNHSEGFEWGYAGSGPAQTALALLLDHTGDPILADRLHQDFKSDFLLGLDGPWRITGKQIDDWLIGKRQAPQKGALPKSLTRAPMGQTMAAPPTRPIQG